MKDVLLSFNFCRLRTHKQSFTVLLSGHIINNSSSTVNCHALLHEADKCNRCLTDFFQRQTKSSAEYRKATLFTLLNSSITSQSTRFKQEAQVWGKKDRRIKLFNCQGFLSKSVSAGTKLTQSLHTCA